LRRVESATPTPPVQANAESEFSDSLREFFQAARRARGRAAQRPAANGLSLAQFHLLEPLGDGPLANCRLAESAGIAPATATRMVDALAARGLVTRVEDATDRRAVAIALTDSGRVALAAKLKEYDVARRKIASALDEDEQRVAADLLRRLAEVIEEL
jgi:DNA-binding MarR family transcriptional regulator